MIIIVEGIDRVGKTTLCDKLSEELNIKIFRREFFMQLNEFDNKNETDKMIQLLNIVNEIDGDIIFDRLYFSDYIYGLLERHYMLIDAVKNFAEIDKYASSLKDVFLIQILPTNIKDSSMQHGKNLTAYQELFDAAFTDSKIKNKFRCNYNTMNEAISFIKANMKR